MSDLNVYTTNEINALTPITGDLVVDSDLNAIKLYDGANWRTWNSDSTATPFNNDYSSTLDGTNDYVDFGSPSVFDFGTSDFTLSTWFKPASLVGSYINLLSSHVGGGDWGLFVNSSATIQFYNGAFYSGSGVVLNAWNHAMVVRDSTDMKIYLNGDKKSSGSIGAGTSVSMGASGVSVSTHDLIGNDRYHGLVDEIAVWQSAISDGGTGVGATAGGDIATIYNSGVPHDLDTLSSQPTGWWRMGDSDSGSGTTVTDVGQGVGGVTSDATLHNGAAFSSDVPS